MTFHSTRHFWAVLGYFVHSLWLTFVIFLLLLRGDQCSKTFKVPFRFVSFGRLLKPSKTLLEIQPHWVSSPWKCQKARKKHAKAALTLGDAIGAGPPVRARDVTGGQKSPPGYPGSQRSHFTPILPYMELRRGLTSEIRAIRQKVSLFGALPFPGGGLDRPTSRPKIGGCGLDLNNYFCMKVNPGSQSNG